MDEKRLLFPGQRQGLFLLPLLFWLLPSRWLERGPSLCLVRRVTGRPCPGCGMLRALSYLAHGDPRRAWQYNRLVIVVAPLLAFIWLQACIKTNRLSSFTNRNIT